MDDSTAAAKLVSTLKQQFKLKGLHYREVAERLAVSEGTVKRYFSGKGLTLQVMEQLAGIVELDLISLAALTDQLHKTQRTLNREQLAALRANKMALAVFVYLSLGLTPPQLAREFDIADQIDRVLGTLESLGLIRKLSNDSVKLLVRPPSHSFSWLVDSEVRSRKVRFAREFITGIDLNDERCEWMDLTARLSAESVGRLREIMTRLASDLATLTKNDLSLPPEKTQWYQLFLGAEPVSRKKIFRRK